MESRPAVELNDDGDKMLKGEKMTNAKSGRIRVLVVAGGFYPAKKYGGPVVSIDNMCTLLQSEMEFYLVARNHDLGEEEPLQGISDGWNKRKNCYVCYLPDGDLTEHTFIKIFKDVTPDITYVNSLFDAKFTLPFLKICKKLNCPVFLAPRGQLCAGALNNDLSKKIKKLAYIYFLRVSGLLKTVSYQSTSDEETQSILKYLKSDSNKVYFLTNVPSVPENDYSKDKKRIGEGRFIFLSRIHPKKNLISAIRFFENVRGNVVFDIYGPIEDENYWTECQRKINGLPDNVTVNYRGLVEHDKTLFVFSQYDALLFPTFSENYGHVIAEALMAGTPVIISDQTPWNDVNLFKSGWALPLCEPKMFTNAIQTVVDSDCSELRKNVKKYTKNKIQYDEIHDCYMEIFNSLKRFERGGNSV
jgi:glycosyltransferase involved in cell wall biosynthesis